MQGKARRTRSVTLYRLNVPPPIPDDISTLVDLAMVHERSTHPVNIAGSPALWVHGVLESADGDAAAWCADAARTTGVPVSIVDRRSLGLLLIVVDDHVYAIGYGQGHRLVRDDLKDHRFGIAFAVRTFEALHLTSLLRRRPGARGRSDATFAPAGLPIWGFGVEDHADLVGRIAGRAHGLDLTCSSDEKDTVQVSASAGIRMHLGIDPACLKADIQEIARICQEEEPRPDLEYIERIQPVKDPAQIGELDAALDDRLGKPVGDVANSLTLVVPTLRLIDYLRANSFAISLRTRVGPIEHLELHHLLDRTRQLESGTRVQALRRGHVRLYSDHSGGDPIGPATSADKWLEANVGLGARRFSMVDGRWYEVDGGYLERLRESVERVLGQRSDIRLPPWRVDDGEGERSYNSRVQRERPGEFLCLDRKGIKDRFHWRNGVEICDLLSRDGTIVHVKHAHGSAPLSHLFTQALLAVQTLRNSPEARHAFVDQVERLDQRWQLPATFEPKRLVFAILLKQGEPLGPDTLFPFAQVALVQIERTLKSVYDVDVEVIGIDAETGNTASRLRHVPTPRDGDATDGAQLRLPVP